MADDDPLANPLATTENPLEDATTPPPAEETPPAAATEESAEKPVEPALESAQPVVEEKTALEEPRTPQKTDEPPTRAIATPAPPWDEAWRVARSSLPSLTVKVEKAETVGSTLSRHVVYHMTTRILIEGKQTELQGARRFSEFATLREALAKRYAGLLVPPIPPKVMSVTAKGSEESALTKTRLRLLSTFADEISKLPWVADDAALRAFCGKEPEWQKYAKEDDTLTVASSPVLSADESVGRGRALWYATIAKAPPAPEGMDKVLYEVVHRIESLQVATDAAMKAAQKAAVACQTRAEALQQFHDRLDGWRGESTRWSALAKDVPCQLGREPVQSQTPSAERCSTAVVSALDAWARDAEFDAPTVDRSIGTGAQWQHLFIQSMRDLIAQRRDFQDDLLKARKHVAALKQQKAAGAMAAVKATTPVASRTSKFLSSFSKSPATQPTPVAQGGAPVVQTPASNGASLDAQLEEAVKQEEEKRRVLELHARALCYCELDRFNEDYCTNQNTWADLFFSDMAALSAKAKKTWDNAHDAFGFAARV